MKMNTQRSLNKNNHGFSLVELMISISIGLIVILVVGNIFMASRKTINSTEAVGKLQESSRISFELLARSIRESGANNCSTSVTVGSTLNSLNSAWWSQWRSGIMGYNSSTASPGTAIGTAVGQRVASTDVIDVHSAVDSDANVVNIMTSGSSAIQTDTGSSFRLNDIVVVCDTTAAFMFQVTGGAPANLQHSSGSGSPGNCAQVFSYDDTCNNGATGYLFKKNAVVSKVKSYRWYIGNNPNGGRSLYRAELTNTGLTATPTQIETIEVAADVTDLDATYFVRGATNYVTADLVTNWRQVSSVKIRLSMSVSLGNQRDSGFGTAGNTIERSSTQVIALRNR